MATTDLVAAANRLGARAYLQVSVTSVAIDAAVSENFRVPASIGDVLVEQLQAFVGGFSADYLNPDPQNDGFNIVVTSSDAATVQDIIGSGRATRVGGSAALRPTLVYTVDLNNPTIVRTNELISITLPILAGAGATATVSCRVRGLRLRLP